jgi:uncharacterized protein (DUF1015 family)
MPHVAPLRGTVSGARDASRALYRYHQTFHLGGRPVTRKLMIAVVRLSPWSEGVIRPHEVADPATRDAELAAIRTSSAHGAPVLAGYRDAATEVERLFRGIDGATPAIATQTADGTQHKLWRVQNAELFGKLRTLFAPKKLHVLDGHARYEAMLAYQASLGDLAQYSTGNYGLFCLVNLDDPALVTAACHRIVRAGITRDALLANKHFIVEKLAGAARDAAAQRAALGDAVAHQPAFVAVFHGDADAYKLTLSPDVSPVNEGVPVHRALQRYDPVVLQHLLLPATPTETTIDHLVALDAVAKGAAAAVILRPLSLDQLIHADELGQALPPGSAAFPPALESFVSFAIDRDEDVS